MLDRGNQSLQDILQTLRVYHAHIDDDDSGEATISQKNVLDELISALDSTGTS
jgi:beta-catenin-like protein 1